MAQRGVGSASNLGGREGHVPPVSMGECIFALCVMSALALCVSLQGIDQLIPELASALLQRVGSQMTLLVIDSSLTAHDYYYRR